MNKESLKKLKLITIVFLIILGIECLYLIYKLSIIEKQIISLCFQMII